MIWDGVTHLVDAIENDMRDGLKNHALIGISTHCAIYFPKSTWAAAGLLFGEVCMRIES